jgi:phosphoglycerol transferase MdoB-like AlkP superfamily enzyme
MLVHCRYTAVDRGAFRYRLFPAAGHCHTNAFICSRERRAGQVQSIRNVLEKQGGCYILLAYTAAAILFKSTVLCGYLLERPFLESHLKDAVQNIPVLSLHVCFVLIVVAVALLFGNKGRYWCLFSLNLALSTLFVIDLWNYRAFVKFTSFYNLRQVTSRNSASPSIAGLIHLGDFIFLLDLPLVAALCRMRRHTSRKHLSVVRNTRIL